ncbi:GNAT family N-acetyltransferase [Methylobacterium phyllosphaerae]
MTAVGVPEQTIREPSEIGLRAAQKHTMRIKEDAMFWSPYECKYFEFSEVRLIPVHARHTERIIKWRNNPDNKRWFTSHVDIDKSGHLAWLYKQQSAGNNMNWMIESLKFGPVGMVSIYNIEHERKRAEFGRLLVGHVTDRAKGYGAMASKLAVEVAYRAGLEQLYLFVKPGNLAAIKIYKKIGFAEYDTARDTLEMRATLANLERIAICESSI